MGDDQSDESVDRAWTGAPGAALLVALLMVTGGLAAAPPVSASNHCDATVGDGDSIQAAVDAALPGETVCVEAGTYDESVTIPTDHLTLDAEDGATVTDTVTVAAHGVTLAGLEVAPTGNWWVHGIDVSGTVEDLTLDGTTVTGDFMGLWIGGSAGVDGLTVTDALFDGTRIGIYTQHDPNLIDDVADLRNVTDVTIEDTRFVDNVRKGIYAETLSNATIRNISVSGIVSETYGFNNGIDINLKAGDYQDIRILDSTVEDVAEGDPGNRWTGEVPSFSSAVAIKARDDPSSYDEHPATLTGVVLDNLTVRNSFNGLRLGEPGVDYDANEGPQDVTLTGSSFESNERYQIQDLPDALDLGATIAENSFDRAVTVAEDGEALTPTVWSTLLKGLDVADADDRVAAHGGTYEGPLAVQQPGLTLAGEDGATVTDPVTVAADRVTLDGLAVEPSDSRDNGVLAGGTIEDLTLDGVRIAGADNGFRVSNANGVHGLTITGDTVFEGNEIGIYLAHNHNEVPGPKLEDVTDVTIEDTRFLDHEQKGIYAETLSDAVFRNVTVSGIADDDYPVNGGIDINLKAGDYQDIRIENSTVENVTEGEPLFGNPSFSVAVAVKARDDGAYSDNPATLDDVVLDNVAIRDNFNGFRLGEPGVDYSQHQAPTNVRVIESSFVGNEAFGFINEAERRADVSHKWWGSPAGPTLNATTAPVTGDAIRGPAYVAPFCAMPTCEANAAVHGSPAPHVAAGASADVTTG